EVEEDGDSVAGEHVDDRFDAVEVTFVVLAPDWFDTGPEDAEPNRIEAVVGEELTVAVVEVRRRRDVGRERPDGIDPVEEGGATLGVADERAVRVKRLCDGAPREEDAEQR